MDSGESIKCFGLDGPFSLTIWFTIPDNDFKLHDINFFSGKIFSSASSHAYIPDISMSISLQFLQDIVPQGHSALCVYPTFFFPLDDKPSSDLLIVTVLPNCSFPIPPMCLTLFSEGQITMLGFNSYTRQSSLLTTNIFVVEISISHYIYHRRYNRWTGYLICFKLNLNL